MAVYNFGTMVNLLKKNPKKIVFTEGTDVRILEAASRLLASNFLTPVLIGKPEEIEKIAEDEGYNIRGAEIIDPENFDRFEEMVEQFCELRKSKGVTPAQARGPIPPLTLSVRHCRSSRPSRAAPWYLPASSWSVRP